MKPSTARITVWVAAVLALAACQGDNGSPQQESSTGTTGENACAQPTTEAVPSTVAPGSEVAVTVDLGCADTPNDPSVQTVTGVEIVWDQDGQSSVLATTDSDASGLVSVTVTVPQDASPGEATLTAGTAAPITVTVET